MAIFASSVTLSVTLEGIPTLIHQLLVIRVIRGNYYYLLNLSMGCFLCAHCPDYWFTFFFYFYHSNSLTGELLVLA